MVVLTLGIWLGTQALGFALVYYPGVTANGLVVGASLRRSFGAALVFSSATLASLSFSDLAPRSMTYHAVAAAETLVGLAIITVTISYILNVYQVIQGQHALASALHHQAEDGGDPRSILAPHFVDGRPEGLSTHLREFHRGLVEQGEGLRRYPIVFYFQSRQTYRSIPYLLHVIGGVVAALRWGLPMNDPATVDPWLPSLATGYQSVMREVEHNFIPRVGPTEPVPAPLDRFRDALGDERLAEFVKLTRFMGGITDLHDLPDPEEAYRRYCEWLPFATESAAFVLAIATDLGIDIGDIVAEPDTARF